LFKDVFNDAGPPQVATDRLVIYVSSSATLAAQRAKVIGLVTTYCQDDGQLFFIS
jgi:hypothetical protein